MEKTVSGTREWASHSFNVVKGCSHGCLYCYAHGMAARFGRLHEGGWTHEECRDYRARRFRGTVMFPTTHDLTPGNAHHTILALRALLEAGNNVLIVSKPHFDIISKICDTMGAHRDRMLFRFTIGTANQKTLDFFEPGAPSFEERLLSLQYAYEAGYRTSVSMEPLLEVHEDRVVALVDTLAPFVTEDIWIGKLNRARVILSQNGHLNDRAERAISVIHNSQTDDRVLAIVGRLASRPLIRWKESIKAVAGFDLRTDASEGEAWVSR